MAAPNVLVKQHGAVWPKQILESNPTSPSMSGLEYLCNYDDSKTM